MNLSLLQLTEGLQINPPASLTAITELEKKLNQALPFEYKKILSFGNGMEGFFGDNQQYIQLWTAEDIINANKEYNTQESIPGIYLIGSDGEHEAFAVDMRSSSGTCGNFFILPFPLDWEEADRLGKTAEEFLQKAQNPFNIKKDI